MTSPAERRVTTLNTYVFGDDAIFSVFLGKNPEDGSKNYLNKVA